MREISPSAQAAAVTRGADTINSPGWLEWRQLNSQFSPGLRGRQLTCTRLHFTLETAA
jgi:hypothetical protein